MQYEDCTINQYIKAKFKKDYTEISKEQLKEIETEYVDTSGLYDSEEFAKTSYIHYLTNRKNSIALSIRLQEEFLVEFGVPFIQELKFLKKFGHTVTWNGDVKDFNRQIRKIEEKEARYTSQLEKCIKELIELRKKNDAAKGEEKIENRGSFIATLISLGKIGYDIRRDETTMEDLAYMIKKQMEEVEQIKNKKVNG